MKLTLSLALTLLLCLVISSNALSKNKFIFHHLKELLARPPDNCVWFYEHPELGYFGG